MHRHFKEAQNRLNNQTFYKKLETCPTEEHTRLIENTLEEFVHNGDISEAVAEGLKPSNSNPIWTGGRGKMAPLRVFAKYLITV